MGRLRETVQRQEPVSRLIIINHSENIDTNVINFRKSISIEILEIT